MDALLMLEKSFDYPSASAVTLKDMGEIVLYQNTTKYKRDWPCEYYFFQFMK